MTKNSDIVTGLESYATRLKIEFKHAAKCLSDFRRCHMTASIYDLGRLSIGDYRNLRTILVDARRDGAAVGDLLAEIEKRREQHDAGLRRLKDADTRAAETTGQATEKEKAIEDALIDFIDCVHEELDFIRRTSAHGLLTNGESGQVTATSATGRRSNRRSFTQEEMAKACGVTVKTIKNWEKDPSKRPVVWDGTNALELRYSPKLRDDPIKARLFGMWYKVERENAKKIRKARS